MKEQSVSNVLGTTIEKIRNLVDVSTIIGDPMEVAEGVKVIPVSKVTYGFASGGSDFPSKSNQELFGGGGGAGISLTPICFLIVKGDDISIKHISTEEGSLERVIGMVPDVVDKVSGAVSKAGKGKSDAVDFNHFE